MVPSIQDSFCREMSRAVYRGSTAGVTFWLIVGANPSRSVYGSTPAIHAAAELNRVRALKLLLAVGADPNLKTKFEMTPLWCAKNMKAEEAAAILIRAGGYAYVSPDAP
jgi:ankyrin repeat protein